MKIEIVKPDQGQLAVYLVERPDDHPVWSHYGVALLHLRPEEGLAPPFKQFPEATHELCVFAMQPNVTHDTTHGHRLFATRLEGPNLVEQFKVSSDEAALDILDKWLAKIPSLDTDWRSAQRAILSELVAASWAN